MRALPFFSVASHGAAVERVFFLSLIFDTLSFAAKIKEKKIYPMLKNATHPWKPRARAGTSVDRGCE